MDKLKEDYEESCNNYIEVFCKKQDMNFEGWVANQVGDIAMCSDFYFNFRDIVWDINNNQPKGDIVDWYYEVLEDPIKSISYYGWTKSKKREIK